MSRSRIASVALVALVACAFGCSHTADSRPAVPANEWALVELLEQAYDLIRAHGRSFTAATSVNLRVQRGEAVIDLAVGPIAAHTPEELEAPGGHHTPVYRQR